MRAREKSEDHDLPPPTPESEISDAVRQEVLADVRPLIRGFTRDHDMPPGLDEANRERLSGVKKQAARSLAEGEITEAQYAELMAEVRAQEQQLKGGGA